MPYRRESGRTMAKRNSDSAQGSAATRSGSRGAAPPGRNLAGVAQTKRCLGLAASGAVLATGLAIGSLRPAAAQEAGAAPAVAKVTVTNLAKGQILTPAVFYTHSPEAPPLFVPGEPASPELARLAEQGSTGGLMNRLRAEGASVLSVELMNRFVRPGQTAEIDVPFDAAHRLISSASMIEMTNDGFVSLEAVEIPCEGVQTYLLDGWDAGSESNTELCADVPARCPTPRQSGRCSVEGVEGFVHVHGGVHGCGGFPAEQYDWRNPVAKVTIEPVPDRSPPGALAAACPGGSRP